MKTVNEIKNAGYALHHTSLCRGYQSVKGETITEYYGRFGTGYVVYSHNPKSTNYCFISYYIK